VHGLMLISFSHPPPPFIGTRGHFDRARECSLLGVKRTSPSDSVTFNLSPAASASLALACPNLSEGEVAFVYKVDRASRIECVGND
jgi:hypothetical protein